MTCENGQLTQPEVLQVIKNFIEEEVQVIPEDLVNGPDDLDFHRELARDIRISELFFLYWLKENFLLKRVLYPCAGYDRIPSIAIGPKQVFETSLEEYGYGGAKYLQFSSAHTFIADNTQLPFGHLVFDTVLLLDCAAEMVIPPQEEFYRVLKEGGLVAISTNNLVDDDKGRLAFYQNSIKFKPVPVPDCLQEIGLSESRFYLFSKI